MEPHWKLWQISKTDQNPNTQQNTNSDTTSELKSRMKGESGKSVFDSGNI